ncbi:ABC transporter substrate-binding protein [Cryobacterium sp. Hz9]|uniref:ABC transporter substrate-binding protein n=1 Tax=Cryobacterium sp. Hz9 TaxID=1259167 RepID=UPI00106A73AC|nr:extracellular solute-binding protein [Cryobacterium sp. Hz9]TFB67521.1 extracellular solute-binding protein [Cryobacterium sp. Hz9]
MFRSSKRKAVIATAALALSGVLALSACSGGGADAGSGAFDPDADVTLNFAFWGNDVRADLYTQAIAAFNVEHPNITVNSTFLDFPAFWEKRQTEAAGGGLPDVMQFDYSYLRQYSESNLLLDLEPYFGDTIATDGLSEGILQIGVVNDVTTAIPTSTNAWGMFTNPKLMDSLGVEPYEGGGSWQDYSDWMESATAAGAEAGVYGGSDWTGRIQNFEIQLRSEGSFLFDDAGKAGFDKERLAEFWNEGAPVREEIGIPAQRVEELMPLSPFASAVATSELTWDNFGSGYLGSLGESYTELDLVAPPVTVEGSADLYLKPSMLHAVAATTEHPEASTILVDFLINSPEAGAIFGTNRGLPASETQLAGVELAGLDAQIRDYEATIADRLGDAPPVPITGFGTLENKFLLIGQELGYDTITVDEAVEQFFAEMDVVLN